VESPAGGLIVWFTGLSSAGKTTLCTMICNRLAGAGYRAEHLDGDRMRRHVSKGLGFSREDRNENLRRICFVAELLKRHGVIVLVAAISPYREVRDEIRKKIGDRFVEVFINAPLDICEKRDVKGLYKKARAGLITDFTGLDAPYEEPHHAEVECRTDIETIEQSAEKVFQFLMPLLRQAANS
jgi:adenylylsulfate kinase